MKVSPLTIEIMLECDPSAEPGCNIQEHIWNSESGQASRYWLHSHDLIDMDNKATDKGRAWVEVICATPVPVQSWKLPDRTTEAQ